MLDKKERCRVIELFESGRKISEIAKNVGVSRQTVYNVIRDDFEKDPELHALKKDVKKTELRKKIEELREPIKTRSKLDTLDTAVYHLMVYVLLLWRLNPELRTPDCFYCGGSLECHEEKSPKGEITSCVYECRECGRAVRLA